jgi:hypothetical protein
MRWCTVEHIHLDRVASLWLIRRFVDPGAEFAFVPRGTRLDQLAAGVVPVAIPGAELGPHDQDGSCFAKVARAYRVSDPGVTEVGQVVGAALRALRHDEAPAAGDRYGQLGVGLAAVSDGMRLSCPSDRAILDASGPVYDALHAQLAVELIIRRDGLVPPPPGPAGVARRLAFLRGLLADSLPPEP